jgi:hypothetical protein
MSRVHNDVFDVKAKRGKMTMRDEQRHTDDGVVATRDVDARRRLIRRARPVTVTGSHSGFS